MLERVNQSDLNHSVNRKLQNVITEQDGLLTSSIDLDALRLWCLINIQNS